MLACQAPKSVPDAISLRASDSWYFAIMSPPGVVKRWVVDKFEIGSEMKKAAEGVPKAAYSSGVSRPVSRRQRCYKPNGWGTGLSADLFVPGNASCDPTPKIILNATPIATPKATPTATFCIPALSAAPKHSPRQTPMQIRMRVMESLKPRLPQ